MRAKKPPQRATKHLEVPPWYLKVPPDPGGNLAMPQCCKTHKHRAIGVMVTPRNQRTKPGAATTAASGPRPCAAQWREQRQRAPCPCTHSVPLTVHMHNAVWAHGHDGRHNGGSMPPQYPPPPPRQWRASTTPPWHVKTRMNHKRRAIGVTVTPPDRSAQPGAATTAAPSPRPSAAQWHEQRAPCPCLCSAQLQCRNAVTACETQARPCNKRHGHTP
jgi:hypothetical protein